MTWLVAHPTTHKSLLLTWSAFTWSHLLCYHFLLIRRKFLPSLLRVFTCHGLGLHSCRTLGRVTRVCCQVILCCLPQLKCILNSLRLRSRPRPTMCMSPYALQLPMMTSMLGATTYHHSQGFNTQLQSLLVGKDPNTEQPNPKLILILQKKVISKEKTELLSPNTFSHH